MKTFALSELTVAFVVENASEVAEALKKLGVTEAETDFASRVEVACEKAVADAQEAWKVGEATTVENALTAERKRANTILKSAFAGQEGLAAKLIEDGVEVAEALQKLMKDAQDSSAGGKAPLALVRDTEPEKAPAAASDGEVGSEQETADLIKQATKAAGVETHG